LRFVEEKGRSRSTDEAVGLTVPGFEFR